MNASLTIWTYIIISPKCLGFQFNNVLRFVFWVHDSFMNGVPIEHSVHATSVKWYCHQPSSSMCSVCQVTLIWFIPGAFLCEKAPSDTDHLFTQSDIRDVLNLFHKQLFLNHQGQVMHICVRKLCHHWFRYCSVISQTIRNLFQFACLLENRRHFVSGGSHLIHFLQLHQFLHSLDGSTNTGGLPKCFTLPHALCTTKLQRMARVGAW